MEIDREKQAQALAKAKAIIADAEKKREAARVEKGVQVLMQGKLDTLYNEELVENLASYILNKFILDEKQDAIRLLDKLGKALCYKKTDIRERALMVVSVFTEIILEEDFQEFREVLSRILVEWLKYESEYIAGFEFVCSQLQRIILRMLYAGQWDTLENLIIILSQIGSGVIAKSNLIRGMTAKVHENLAEPDILDKLVNVYLDEEDERRLVAESLLLHLGRFSAMFLVQKMIYSNNKEERFALIGLIPRIGDVSVPVLKKCLEDEPPWFVIRNVILIVSRLEDPGLFSMVEPYLTHKDIRVQQQVINCIEMLGGKQMRKRLIIAMMSVNDELKGQLIVHLAQFEGMDVGNAFIDLLENRLTIARHVLDDLLLKLCIKMKFYPMPRAVDCLKELIVERKERFGEADKIALAAATSLQAIEIKLREDKDDEEDTVEEQGAAPEEEQTITAEDIEDENEMTVLAGDGDLSLFSDDEIDGFDSDADIAGTFADDISGGGQEKKGPGEEMPFYASQEHHLMVWSNLYDLMSTEEVNDFFALLKPVSFEANDEIVHQGEKITNLYLIDSGFAGVSHIDSEGEVLITSLQTGELIGSEGFIRDLKWSVSLTAQTDLQVRVLEREGYNRLEEKYPDLSEKLRYYCNHYDVIPYLINLSEDPESEPVGSEINVFSNSLILDDSDSSVDGDFPGTLMYIARGGYCFCLPYTNEGNAETILGRQVSSEILLKDGSERKCFGVIAAAGIHDHDDQVLYVYVKFYHPFEKADYSCVSLEMM